jgi:hypothetical protein
VQDAVEVAIISDFRRKYEDEYYWKYFANVITVRIEASNSIKNQRGWHFDQ